MATASTFSATVGRRFSPPSLHPATGAPYRWLTVDTLEHVTVGHLPKLPDDIVAQLAEALAPFGYEAPPERPDRVAHESVSGDWRDVNEAALARPADWAPALGAKRDGSSWRMQATWRNGDGRNVSIHANGIKDWVRDEGYSPIDLVAAVREISPGEAKDWLQERLGFQEPEPIRFEFTKPGAAANETAPRIVNLSGAVALTGIKSVVAPRRIIVVDTAAAQEGKPPPRRIAKLVNGNELRALPKNKPWFFVEGAIPGRKVSLLMGEDGSGKSYLTLMLALAAATGGNWLGLKVMRGPVVFLTAEEEEEDVWERIAAIEQTLGTGPLDLSDFHLFTIDANDDLDDGYVLGSVDKGKIQMTALWRTLLHAVDLVKPVCLMLDPLVEIFDGDEMVRAQSRQFVSPIRSSARKSNLAVYLAGHPSKASVKDKTGTAGSTGWSATSRARQFYEIIYDAENNPTSGRQSGRDHRDQTLMIAACQCASTRRRRRPSRGAIR